MTEKIRISTDSTSDISPLQQKNLDITVLPLTVLAGEKEYRDGCDITALEFYPLLKQADKLPVSSAVTPYAYTQFFEETYQDGYTDLIHTTINSKGSCTYQNALLAKDMFFQKYPEAIDTFQIHVIDSLSYSMGYGLAVMEAAKQVQHGAGVDAVLSSLHDWLSHSRILVVPLDLQCLKKSGRLSAAAAFITDAIGLKPIITFENGEAKVLDKVRGEKVAIKRLLKRLRKEHTPGTRFMIARAANQAAFEVLLASLEQNPLQAEQDIFYLGCIISINIGPNAVGIVYYSKDLA